MKCKLTSLLVVSTIVLTSVSECKKSFNLIILAPISAEVNGVEYYSKGYTITQHYTNCASYSKGNGCRFMLHRLLYSETDESIPLSIKLESNDNYLKIDTTYLCGFAIEGCHFSDGNIRFSEISDTTIGGTFEFEIKDPETQEVITSVKNGKFDIPYI